MERDRDRWRRMKRDGDRRRQLETQGDGFRWRQKEANGDIWRQMERDGDRRRQRETKMAHRQKNAPGELRELQVGIQRQSQMHRECTETETRATAKLSLQGHPVSANNDFFRLRV